MQLLQEEQHIFIIYQILLKIPELVQATTRHPLVDGEIWWISCKWTGNGVQVMAKLDKMIGMKRQVNYAVSSQIILKIFSRVSRFLG
jgi:hypothetical protein